jgi:hypothetical protein
MKNTGLPRVGWRRSTYSFSNGNCVEVAGIGTVIAVRDSQDQDGPQLTFAPERWAAFAAAVKATHQNCRFPVNLSNSQPSFPLDVQLEDSREARRVLPGDAEVSPTAAVLVPGTSSRSGSPTW